MKLEGDAKILIADDLPEMRVALRRALARLGFRNVFETADGTEALAALEANSDTLLVISDWNMEPMDGLALLTAVRADVRFQELPFILVSADAGVNLCDQARAAGVSLILPKPFDVEILRQTIAALDAR